MEDWALDPKEFEKINSQWAKLRAQITNAVTNQMNPDFPEEKKQAKEEYDNLCGCMEELMTILGTGRGV